MVTPDMGYAASTPGYQMPETMQLSTDYYDPLRVSAYTGGSMQYMPNAQLMTPSIYGAFRTMPYSGINQYIPNRTPTLTDSFLTAYNGFGLFNTYNPAEDPIMRQYRARRHVSDSGYGIQLGLQNFALGSIATLPFGILGALGASAILPDISKPLTDRVRQAREVQNMTMSKIVGGSEVNKITGQGFNSVAAYKVDQGLRQMAVDDQIFNEGDNRNILKLGMEYGMYDYDNSAQQYIDTTKKLSKTIKGVMHIVGSSDFKDILSELKRLQTMGADMNQVSDIMYQENAYAKITGLTHKQLVDTFGAQGAMIYNQRGLDASRGSLTSVANVAALTVAQRQGVLSNSTIARNGGISGMTQKMTEGQATMEQNMEHYISAYIMNDDMTGIDQDRLRDFNERLAKGDLSLTDIMKVGGNRLSKLSGTQLDMFKNGYSKGISDKLSKQMGNKGMTAIMGNLALTLGKQHTGGKGTTKEQLYAGARLLGMDGTAALAWITQFDEKVGTTVKEHEELAKKSQEETKKAEAKAQNTFGNNVSRVIDFLNFNSMESDYDPEGNYVGGSAAKEAEQELYKDGSVGTPTSAEESKSTKTETSNIVIPAPPKINVTEKSSGNTTSTQTSAGITVSTQQKNTPNVSVKAQTPTKDKPKEKTENTSTPKDPATTNVTVPGAVIAAATTLAPTTPAPVASTTTKEAAKDSTAAAGSEVSKDSTTKNSTATPSSETSKSGTAQPSTTSDTKKTTTKGDKAPDVGSTTSSGPSLSISRDISTTIKTSSSTNVTTPEVKINRPNITISDIVIKDPKSIRIEISGGSGSVPGLNSAAPNITLASATVPSTDANYSGLRLVGTVGEQGAKQHDITLASATMPVPNTDTATATHYAGLRLLGATEEQGAASPNITLASDTRTSDSKLIPIGVVGEQSTNNLSLSPEIDSTTESDFKMVPNALPNLSVDNDIFSQQQERAYQDKRKHNDSENKSQNAWWDDAKKFFTHLFDKDDDDDLQHATSDDVLQASRDYSGGGYSGGGYSGGGYSGGGDFGGGSDKADTSNIILPSGEGLGALSANFESRGNSDTIGWDKAGGTSYGKYQIAAKTGTMDRFLKWAEKHGGENGAEVAKRMRAAGPLETGGRDGAAVEEWKKLVSEGKIGDLEHQFIKETHFDHTMKNLNPELQKMVMGSKTLQDVVWSTSVALGVGGAPKGLNAVYKPGMSEEDFIKAVYNYRDTRYGSSTPQIRKSVQARDRKESAMALNMLAVERGNPSSGPLPKGYTGGVTQLHVSPQGKGRVSASIVTGISPSKGNRELKDKGTSGNSVWDTFKQYEGSYYGMYSKNGVHQRYDQTLYQDKDGMWRNKSNMYDCTQFVALMRANMGDYSLMTRGKNGTGYAMGSAQMLQSLQKRAKQGEVTELSDTADAKPGDVIIFNGHAAMVAQDENGEMRVIESTGDSSGVRRGQAGTGVNSGRKSVAEYVSHYKGKGKGVHIFRLPSGDNPEQAVKPSEKPTETAIPQVRTESIAPVDTPSKQLEQPKLQESYDAYKAESNITPVMEKGNAGLSHASKRDISSLTKLRDSVSEKDQDVLSMLEAGNALYKSRSGKLSETDGGFDSGVADTMTQYATHLQDTFIKGGMFNKDNAPSVDTIKKFLREQQDKGVKNIGQLVQNFFADDEYSKGGNAANGGKIMDLAAQVEDASSHSSYSELRKTDTNSILKSAEYDKVTLENAKKSKNLGAAAVANWLNNKNGSKLTADDVLANNEKFQKGVSQITNDSDKSSDEYKAAKSMIDYVGKTDSSVLRGEAHTLYLSKLGKKPTDKASRNMSSDSGLKKPETSAKHEESNGTDVRSGASAGAGSGASGKLKGASMIPDVASQLIAPKAEGGKDAASVREFADAARMIKDAAGTLLSAVAESLHDKNPGKSTELQSKLNTSSNTQKPSSTVFPTQKNSKGN